MIIVLLLFLLFSPNPIFASPSPTPTPLPLKPTNLVGTCNPNTNGKVSLSWTDAPSEVKYVISRKVSGVGSSFILNYASVATNVTTFTDADSGTSLYNNYYHYNVKGCRTTACSATGDFTYAGEIAVVCTETVPPTATPTLLPLKPTNIAISCTADKKAKLTWTDATGEVKYRIAKKPKDRTWWNYSYATLVSNTTTYTDPLVHDNAIYEYNVFACSDDACTTSAYGNQVSANCYTPPTSPTPTPLPLKPTNLVGTCNPNTNGKVSLSWTDAPSEVKYVISRKVSGVGSSFILNYASVNANVTTFTDSDSGTSLYNNYYHYNVKGCRTTACSATGDFTYAGEIAVVCSNTVPPPTATTTPTVSPNPNYPICTSGYPPHQNGNANCDNTINLDDYIIWRTERLRYITLTPPSNPSQSWLSDFNRDSKVDLDDYIIWKSGRLNYINSTPTPSSQSLKPTNLYAICDQSTNGKIILNWTRSPIAQGYIISRSSNSGSWVLNYSGTTPLGSDISSFTDIGSSYGNTYRYNVKGCLSSARCFNSGDYAYSGEITAVCGSSTTPAPTLSPTITPTPLPFKPTNLVGTCNPNTNGKVSLSWTDAPSEVKYVISRKVSGVGSSFILNYASVATNVTTFTDADSGTSLYNNYYHYNVKGCRTTACSATGDFTYAGEIAVVCSNATSPTTTTGPTVTPNPLKPTNIAISCTADKKAKLTWTDATGEVKYRIAKKPKDRTWWNYSYATLVSNTITYTDPLVHDNAIYEYNVFACSDDACTTSAYGNQVSANCYTAPTPTPTTPAATATDRPEATNTPPPQ